jgi:hypothetical protein
LKQFNIVAFLQFCLYGFLFVMSKLLLIYTVILSLSRSERTHSDDAGVDVECYIKVIVDSRFKIYLYDSTKDNLLTNPPIMYHLYFQSDMDKAGVDTYTPPLLFVTGLYFSERPV